MIQFEEKTFTEGTRCSFFEQVNNPLKDKSIIEFPTFAKVEDIVEATDSSEGDYGFVQAYDTQTKERSEGVSPVFYVNQSKQRLFVSTLVPRDKYDADDKPHRNDGDLIVLVDKAIKDNLGKGVQDMMRAIMFALSGMKFTVEAHPHRGKTQKDVSYTFNTYTLNKKA